MPEENLRTPERLQEFRLGHLTGDDRHAPPLAGHENDRRLDLVSNPGMVGRAGSQSIQSDRDVAPPQALLRGKHRVARLILDRFALSLHIGSNTESETRKWYDDVVAATSYIGPVFGR